MQEPVANVKADFEALIRFYLACVEEEHKRSLEVSAERKFKQYIVPPGPTGMMFRGEVQAQWIPDDRQHGFIGRYDHGIEKQRFLYGFPIYLNYQKKLAPLFFTEVDIAFSKDKSEVTMRQANPGQVKVNLHPFRNVFDNIEERIDFQDFIESSVFGTIEARVEAALRKLGEPVTNVTQFASAKGEMGWKNAHILMRDTGASFTAQLRRELVDIRKHTNALSATAIAPLMQGPALGCKPVKLLEIAPLNQCQRQAVESALTQPMTLVTGPPGTGKSQVVIAILASMGAAGKSVLFASKNNQAVDVVRSRLNEKLKDADWFVRLGSKANIDSEMQKKIDNCSTVSFDESSTPRPLQHDFNTAQFTRDELENKISTRAELMYEYIKHTDNMRRLLSQLSADWRNLVIKSGFSPWHIEPTNTTLKHTINEVRILTQQGWPGLWIWIKKLILGRQMLHRYSLLLEELFAPWAGRHPALKNDDYLSWSAIADDFETVSTLLKCSSSVIEHQRLTQEIAFFESAITLNQQLKKASKKLQKESVEMFRYQMLSRIASTTKQLPTLIKNYWNLTSKAAKLRRDATHDVQTEFYRAAKQLLNVLPGVIVTSLSARRSLPLEPGLFDCIIIDEASQCDLASAIPLILRAKRIVVIGDPKQLRHISSLQESEEQRIAVEQGITPLATKYSYRAKSLYDCAAEALQTRDLTPFFLKEHYRSHPDIIGFSNQVYYGRKLVIRTDVRSNTEQAIFWHDTPSTINIAGGSLVNRTEARAVRDLVIKVATSAAFEPTWTIGIVTPYRKQREELERLLKNQSVSEELGARLTIGTVHTFQGAESDVMIFSPVVTNGVKPRAAEWISKSEGLLNVALTRARKSLHIVGDRDYCISTPGPLGELAEYVQERSGVKHVARTDSPAVSTTREILNELGFWYQEELPEITAKRTYYLDFVVVGLSGTQYNIEIDSKLHYFSAEAIMKDDARDSVLSGLGYKIMRIQATSIMKNRELTKHLLARLL
jgi:very-short-patch-repair endonuclease